MKFQICNNTKPAVAYGSMARVVSAGLAFHAHPFLMIVDSAAIALGIIILEVLFSNG